MNEVEVLQRAKEVLLEDGWYKGEFQDAAGTVFCALGACHKAAGSTMRKSSISDRWQAQEAGGWFHNAVDFLEKALPDDHFADGVPEYNDDPNTTFADIMALFDNAILIAKEANA